MGYLGPVFVLYIINSLLVIKMTIIIHTWYYYVIDFKTIQILIILLVANLEAVDYILQYWATTNEVIDSFKK